MLLVGNNVAGEIEPNLDIWVENGTLVRMVFLQNMVGQRSGGQKLP